MPWTPEDAAPNYATHGSSSTTWTPFTINVPAFRHIFVTVAVSENPDCTIALDKPGGEINDWVQIARFRPGSGGNLQNTALFGIKTSIPWNHPVQVTFSTAKVGKIANWVSFTGGSLVPRATTDNDAGDVFDSPFNGPYPIPSTTGNSGFSGSMTWQGQSEGRDGDLFIGFQTVGGTTTPPAIDSDTTNGTWVDAGNTAAGGISAGGTDFAMRMSYKLITGRGTQVLNNGVAPLGGVILIPRETAHIITQGGDIDSVTADPAWFFRTSTSSGDILRFPMQAAEKLVGGTMSKPDNSTVGTPSGYTKQGSGKTASNAGTAVNAFEKTSVGTEGAKIVVPITSPDGLGDGSGLRARGGVEELSEWDTIQTVFGADNTVAGTTIVITADGPLDLEPGDKVIYFLAVAFHDPATSIAVTLPGCTFTQYDLAYNGFITDPDGGINVGYCEIDAGGGSVTPGLTATYNSGASAAPAAFVRVRYLLPPPVPPDDVECSDPTSTTLTLSWPTPDPEEFEPTYYEVQLNAETPVNVGLVNSHTFVGLDPDTSYDLFVRACNEFQCSEWVQVTCTTCPPPVENLTATVTPEGVELCWELPS